MTAPAPPCAARAGDSSQAIAADLAAVARIQAIPTLLQVLCESTGMRFAAVARVTDETWTACALHDDLDVGVRVGGPLDVKTTLGHMKTQVSVPIVLPNGVCFGNLCAFDPVALDVAQPRTLAMFERFATLIGGALEQERATRALREDFIAILGHDLRNPLHAIHATSELLGRKSSDPTITSLALRIRNNAKRMSLLIDDALDFARSALGGGMPLKVSETAVLASALTGVVQELKNGHPGREIVADIRVTGTVRCDVGRLEQLVSQLMAHALAHGAPSTPVKLTVHDDERQLAIEVWNAGAEDPRHGRGLGLQLCSEIVRAHGGTLAVTSDESSGTRFRVALPTAAVPWP
jgi:signal transduction histidine kinase